jgi:phosphohistidine phosphatase
MDGVMVLLFLRHGIALDEAIWPGSDETRPLTRDGCREMERTAVAIGSLPEPPALIVSSPLMRARQTADAAAAGFPGPPQVIEDDRLTPGLDAEALAAVLRDHPHRPSIMLVGHESDFSRTIAALTGGTQVKCERGGLVRVDARFKAGLFREGKVIWALPPSLLSQLAERRPQGAATNEAPAHDASTHRRKEATEMIGQRSKMKDASGYADLVVTAAPLARRLLTDRRLRRDVIRMAKSWRRASNTHGKAARVQAREMLASRRIEHLAQRLPKTKGRGSRLPLAGAIMGAGALATVAMLRRRAPAARGSVHILGCEISGEVRMKKAA